MATSLKRFYKVILDYPRFFLGISLVCIGLLGYQIKNLAIDASAETLVLEDDADLKYSRMITDRYETADFVVITLNPKDGNLLSDATLAGIKGLKADLLELAFVDSVTSILDVPLLESPRKPIKELLANVPSLETQPVDRGLAKTEFLDSPVYQEMLVSPDFSTTLLQVNLKENKQWKLLVNRRYALREKQREQGLTTAEEIELGQLQAEFKGVRNQARDDIHQTIQDVRAVIDRHRDIGTLFLGGVDMIADDMITYVKNDLAVFGFRRLLARKGHLRFFQAKQDSEVD